MEQGGDPRWVSQWGQMVYWMSSGGTTPGFGSGGPHVRRQVTTRVRRAALSSGLSPPRDRHRRYAFPAGRQPEWVSGPRRALRQIGTPGGIIPCPQRSGPAGEYGRVAEEVQYEAAAQRAWVPSASGVPGRGGNPASGMGTAFDTSAKAGERSEEAARDQRVESLLIGGTRLGACHRPLPGTLSRRHLFATERAENVETTRGRCTHTGSWNWTPFRRA